MRKYLPSSASFVFQFIVMYYTSPFGDVLFVLCLSTDESISEEEEEEEEASGVG